MVGYMKRCVYQPRRLSTPRIRPWLRMHGFVAYGAGYAREGEDFGDVCLRERQFTSLGKERGKEGKGDCGGRHTFSYQSQNLSDESFEGCVTREDTHRTPFAMLKYWCIWYSADCGYEAQILSVF